MDANIIELEKDVTELDKLIEVATRPNIIRNLENHKKTITSLIDGERKIQESKKEKELKEGKEETKLTSTTSDKYQYTTITKYAFESSDKFAK